MWAAVGHELEGVGGHYLEDFQEAAPYDQEGQSAQMPFHGYMPYALDPDRAKRLWTLSQELVGLPIRL